MNSYGNEMNEEKNGRGFLLFVWNLEMFCDGNFSFYCIIDYYLITNFWKFSSWPRATKTEWRSQSRQWSEKKYNNNNRIQAAGRHSDEINKKKKVKKIALSSVRRSFLLNQLHHCSHWLDSFVQIQYQTQYTQLKCCRPAICTKHINLLYLFIFRNWMYNVHETKSKPPMNKSTRTTRLYEFPIKSERTFGMTYE